MRRGELSRQLKYRIPSMRLCLVGDRTPRKLHPIWSPADAAGLLEPLRYAAEEHFVSLHLNSKHEVIGLHEVSHGTLSASLVHPREVFKAALLANSHAILICHNHPSGSVVQPSKEDFDTTRQLLQAGQLMGILLLDHVIVSPTYEPYSMRENYPQLWEEHHRSILVPDEVEDRATT